MKSARPMPSAVTGRPGRRTEAPAPPLSPPPTISPARTLSPAPAASPTPAVSSTVAAGSSIGRRRAIGVAAGGVAALLARSSNRTSADELTASADYDETTWGTATRVGYGETSTTRWRIGMRLRTPVTCNRVIATFPIPMEWPEQRVTVIRKDVDPIIRGWGLRDLLGGARQVVLQIPRIAAGQSAEAMFEFEVERKTILAPEQTDDLRIPTRVPRDMRRFMGNSPSIDASHVRVRNASKEIAGMEAETDWERVEQIYDYVRDHVKYTEGPIRDASEALQDGEGDCEELTSLFVALCRNARVPARMVWIPGHAYPEFYLEDGDRNGHWFPCQVAGTRQFGRMEEERPVLQKGDRFKPPESKVPVRYVSEFFTCDKLGNRDPDPDFIREQIVN